MPRPASSPDLLTAQIENYLNPRTRITFHLRFPAALEARYDHDRQRQLDVRPRILAFSTIVIGLFTAGDYALSPAHLQRSLLFRVFILVPCSLTILWLLRWPRLRDHSDLLYLIYSLIAATCCVAAFPGDDPVTSLYTQATFVLLLWTILSTTRLKMPLVLACLGCLLIEDMVFLQHSIWLNFMQRLISFAQFTAAALLAGISRHRSDYAERVAYLLRLREELRRDHLTDLNAHLTELSTHDPLTGLANRRLFDEQLHLSWNRALRDDAPVSLAMIDVDHFKRLNDTYGHATGDLVLVFLAKALSANIRQGTDIVARFGGEEFIILFPGLAEEETIHTVERLRLNIASTSVPIGEAQPPIQFSVSCGVASVFPGNTALPSDLVEIADAALYRAKRLGRNRVSV